MRVEEGRAGRRTRHRADREKLRLGERLHVPGSRVPPRPVASRAFRNGTQEKWTLTNLWDVRMTQVVSRNKKKKKKAEWIVGYRGFCARSVADIVASSSSSSSVKERNDGVRSQSPTCLSVCAE